MEKPVRHGVLVLMCTAALLVSACASAPDRAASSRSDPNYMLGKSTPADAECFYKAETGSRLKKWVCHSNSDIARSRDEASSILGGVGGGGCATCGN